MQFVTPALPSLTAFNGALAVMVISDALSTIFTALKLPATEPAKN
jgi:hypothetical protein